MNPSIRSPYSAYWALVRPYCSHKVNGLLDWGYRFAARLSKRMGADCQQRPMYLAARFLSSAFPPTRQAPWLNRELKQHTHRRRATAAPSQECTEVAARSELVTVCSQQFFGEERLQSTAMILIMAHLMPAIDSIVENGSLVCNEATRLGCKAWNK